MNASIPETMKAAAFDRFGGPEVLRVQESPGAAPQASRSSSASRRQDWRSASEVREGELELGRKRKFPQVIGNDGAGTVVALGSAVNDSRSAIACTRTR